jgi:hypothetical protein
MRDIFTLFLHLIVIVIRLVRPGGLRSVVAESVLSTLIETIERCVQLNSHGIRAQQDVKGAREKLGRSLGAVAANSKNGPEPLSGEMLFSG